MSSKIPVSAELLVELVKRGCANNPAAVPPLVEDWVMEACREIVRLRDKVELLETEVGRLQQRP